MENYHEMVWRWYLEGAQCYSTGGKIEDCPYSPEDEECHKEWMNGFADAETGDLCQ